LTIQIPKLPVAIIMAAVHKPQQLKDLFHNICEFLSVMEETYPLPTHEKLLDQWEDDVRDFWQVNTDEVINTKTQQVFDAVLSFRRDIQEAFIKQNTDANEKNWKWLLDTKQSEQRTEQWVKEKVNLLTASEISDIWGGPLTRARLVKSKVPKSAEEEKPFSQRLAVRRGEGNAMDWGVRYEPVVKYILEKDLQVKITDLGRVTHQTLSNLAASPDGLITEGPEELVGRLVEIKCPPTREINEKIPFSYWCQMQIQMEVCNLPLCEYVEVKFKEVDKGDSEAQGFITLEQNVKDNSLQYIYHDTPVTPNSQKGWEVIETYGWKVLHIRRVTQQRDKTWFESIHNDLVAFWNDVEGARNGTWIPPPPKVKRVKADPLQFLKDD
jgi:hypothetical protein